MLTHVARILGTLLLVASLSPVSAAWAGDPTDQLRDGVERVFKILRDPAMAGDANVTKRRTAIFAAADSIFDFREMARRSLGQHWAPRTPVERTRFVTLFTELIQQSYIAKIDQHGKAKMAFRGETVEGGQAAVRTTIPLSNGSEMPLEYRMHNVDSRWRVYDLSIDGVSLVSNYRAQFNKIIRIESFDILVAKLTSHQLEFASPAPKTAR